MPTSGAGKWAGRLLILSVACYAAFFVLVASGQRGGDTFFSNVPLAVAMLSAVASAVAAGGYGVAALLRRDRSVVVVLSVVIGSLVAMWTAAELLFPH